jgi:hypothetical protein
MIYCQKCGSVNADDAAKCAKCGEALTEKIDDDNERPLVQKLHQQENKARESNDTAMSFIILGIIFIILGLVFFVLSFKLPYAAAQNKVLIVTCFEFWVSLISLTGGAGSLVYGLIVLSKNLRKLKVLKTDIDYIRQHKSAKVPNRK